MYNPQMAAPYKYDMTAKGVMKWACHEMEHMGRIIAVKDPHIQKSYAYSTLNGMAHAKDALFELVNDPNYATHKTDLLKKHDALIRVMKHLIKDFDLDLKVIKSFNTEGTLSNLGYLSSGGKTRKNSRKNNRK
jgi:hypothetical protein